MFVFIQVNILNIICDIEMQRLKIILVKGKERIFTKFQSLSIMRLSKRENLIHQT